MNVSPLPPCARWVHSIVHVAPIAATGWEKNEPLFYNTRLPLVMLQYFAVAVVCVPPS